MSCANSCGKLSDILHLVTMRNYNEIGEVCLHSITLYYCCSEECKCEFIKKNKICNNCNYCNYVSDQLIDDKICNNCSRNKCYICCKFFKKTEGIEILKPEEDCCEIYDKKYICIDCCRVIYELKEIEELYCRCCHKKFSISTVNFKKDKYDLLRERSRIYDTDRTNTLCNDCIEEIIRQV